MEVFNIRKAQFADKLIASGAPNRWNKKDEFVIYTGGSRALSTLELIAHRAYISVTNPYMLLVIEIQTSETTIKEITAATLPKSWRAIEAYPALQDIGSKWYQSAESLILKVPSAIVPQENNFIINTQHPEFASTVRIANREPFIWDERLL